MFSENRSFGAQAIVSAGLDAPVQQRLVEMLNNPEQRAAGRQLLNMFGMEGRGFTNGATNLLAM
jgi:hypothetical protein